MKTIYLDPSFMCHVTNDGTMTEEELEVFVNELLEQKR